MNRLEILNSLRQHPWFAKLIKRLNANELTTLQAFVSEREGLSKDDYCAAVARWGVIIQPEHKTFKNFPIMNELALIAGTTGAKRRSTK